MKLNDIKQNYLTPNYRAVQKVMNELHGTKYTSRHLKHIHSGKHKYTNSTIKIQIDSMIGPFETWFDFDENGKAVTKV